MKFAVLALVVLAAACGPTFDNEDEADMVDPDGYALQAFEDVYGHAATPACEKRVRTLKITVTDSATVSGVCGVHADGCTTYAADGSDLTYIAQDHASFVVAHEKMHVLLRCETGEGDHDHKSDVWKLGLTSH